MHRSILRKVALLLAGILILAGIEPVALLSEAATSSSYGDGYATTYSLSELTSNGGYGYTLTSGDATSTLTFSGQYMEAKYAIPEDVVSATLTGYCVNLSNSSAGSLTLKVYDASGNQTAVTYCNSSISVDATAQETASGIGLMSLSSDEYSINVDSITFYTADSVLKEEEKEDSGEETTANDTLSYSAKDLDVHYRWSPSSKVSDGVLNFEGQYYEYCIDLPKEIANEDIESITVRISEQNGALAIKLYDTTATADSSISEKNVSYGNKGKTSYSILPASDGNLASIGLMSHDSNDTVPFTAVLEGVDIKLKQSAAGGSDSDADADEDADTDNSFGGEMSFYNRWNSSDTHTNTLTFDGQYQEYCYDLSKSFDMSACDAINITVKDQGNNVCFKFYDADKTELTALYSNNGKTTYTIVPTFDGVVSCFAVMSMPSDSSEYPYSITIEGISFTMRDTSGEEQVEKGVEWDLKDLRDSVSETVGDDFLIGTAVSYQEFADTMEMQLVTKHFNAVTLGNELKPDAMLKSSANIVKVELNGQTFDFPELDYSSGEKFLDYFYKWNQENPDKQIKIRGHVLVWHSQTPEFFFHEDYDTSKPYVSPEVMTLREEYYIKSVAEHFTGENSKYKDMFYGWDVVNEAVSDSTGTYRNAGENSSWWAVYESPEFITNAFVFANKYFPASVELYYNDYNEYVTSKVKGICALLTAVKNTEGARIDGMGMQGHYDMSNPTMAQFKTAAKAYCDIVGQVQLTELDFKGSTSSTDEKLAARYKDLYATVRRLRNEGYNVGGMTIWGVTDKHSWLQSSSSVGGGSTTNTRQYPLLFDDNYKAKASFYALADTSELEPEVKEVYLSEKADNGFAAGLTYTVKLASGEASFVPAWQGSTLTVKFDIKDTTVDATDRITLYLMTPSGTVVSEIKREDITSKDSGYAAVINADYGAEITPGSNLYFDVTVTDGDTVYAFSDTGLKQSERTDYYAKATVKPAVSIEKGTVSIDADASDKAWEKAEWTDLTISQGADVTARAKLLWDDENLYVLVDVKDAVLNKDSSDTYQQDSLEIFIDENNAKTGSYEADDKQYRVNYDNEQSFNGTKCKAENITSATALTETGYLVEAALKWTDISPAKGTVIGLDLQINDASEKGTRSGTLNWADKSGNGWSSPQVFGSALLKETKEETAKKDTGSGKTSGTQASGSSQSAESTETAVSGDTVSAALKTAEAAVPGISGTGITNEKPETVTETETAEEILEETVEKAGEAITEENSQAEASVTEETVTEPEDTVEIEDTETALADQVPEEAQAVSTSGQKVPVGIAVACILVMTLGAAGYWFFRIKPQK